LQRLQLIQPAWDGAVHQVAVKRQPLQALQPAQSLWDGALDVVMCWN
jgi:hypothetical protein